MPILVIMQLRKWRDYASLGERDLQQGILPAGHDVDISFREQHFFRATLEYPLLQNHAFILLRNYLFNLSDNENEICRIMMLKIGNVQKKGKVIFAKALY